MIARLHMPLSLKELMKRTLKESWADDLLSLAAQQAYYFVFALFPALLTVISIASFFPVANLVDEVVSVLGRFAPPDVLTIITDQIKQISQSDQGGVLTLAFLLTIWSSSGAMVSIITTLNAAYDITEGRPFWKVRLTAIALTVGLALFILLSIALVLVGPTLAEHLAISCTSAPAFKWTWWVLQWPVVFLLVATGIGARLLFRARRQAGLGLDHAGLHPRDGALGPRVARRSRLTSATSATTTRPTARSAPSSSS